MSTRPLTREDLRMQYVKAEELKTQRRRESVQKEVFALQQFIQKLNRDGTTKLEQIYANQSQDREWVTDVVRELQAVYVDSDISFTPNPEQRSFRVNVDWTPVKPSADTKKE